MVTARAVPLDATKSITPIAAKERIQWRRCTVPAYGVRTPRDERAIRRAATEMPAAIAPEPGLESESRAGEAESAPERFFMNVALARVLYAHALNAAPRLALGRSANEEGRR